MDEQNQDDQLGPKYYSIVPIQDVALKTYWDGWTIEMCGGRESGRSMMLMMIVSTKLKVVTCLEFELAHTVPGVQHFGHYATVTASSIFFTEMQVY